MFLNDLKLKGENEKYELSMVDSTGWEKIQGFYLPYKYYYFSHLLFNFYPVVNISKSGALLFCEWLSDWYNSQPNRRYKNQKVKFTLPTKDAWEVSASSGIKKITYPWGTNYLRDVKTLKYLCNFNPIGEKN